MNQPPRFDPVTDIKIVSQKERRPNGYFLLEKTVTGHDGQLFDATWRHKGKRFLCFSREGQNALVDLTVLEDGDPTPSGFSALTTTTDDGEKSLRKHVLCYKMQPSNSVQQAVHDLVLIDKTKGENPPHGYFPVSTDVNDITICFRLAPCSTYQQTAVPPAHPQQVGPQPTPTYSSNQYHYASTPHAVGPNRQQWSTQPQARMGQPWIPQPGHQQAQEVHAGQHYMPHHAVPATKPEAFSAIEGLPFQINSKFEILWKKSGPTVPAIQNLSIEDVESKFNYDFSKERRLISRS